MRSATRAVHAGQASDPATGAVTPPVYQSATFDLTRDGAHEYGRISNPTRTALEASLATLEHARNGTAFASGMAAADAILRSLRPGDEVLASSDIYGGTYRLLTTVLAPVGLRVRFVDLASINAVKDALTKRTVLLWIESPTNPLLRIVDIAALSELAHSHGADAIVDNTFASPYLQNPLTLGADLVLHSTTKYLGGHSDAIGGVVCTSSDQWVERLRYQIKCTGAVPGPMDCYLMMRGTRTLAVRMDRHCANARQIATFLEQHANVSRVHYPGLASHAQHALASAQMRDYGGMLSFEVQGVDVRSVLHGVKIFTLAESLGGVESLIGHPATMSHAAMSKAVRLRQGISDNLIRLSVGIEDVADLIEDLDRSLT